MKRGSEVAAAGTVLAAWTGSREPAGPPRVESETTTDAAPRTVCHLMAVPPPGHGCIRGAMGGWRGGLLDFASTPSRWTLLPCKKVDRGVVRSSRSSVLAYGLSGR